MVTSTQSAAPQQFIARSYLFVPGDRPDRFDKAMAAGADAVIVDLEDAVVPAKKNEARAAIGKWLSADKQVVLRINADTTEWYRDDLQLARASGIDRKSTRLNSSHTVISHAVFCLTKKAALSERRCRSPMRR